MRLLPRLVPVAVVVAAVACVPTTTVRRHKSTVTTVKPQTTVKPHSSTASTARPTTTTVKAASPTTTTTVKTASPTTTTPVAPSGVAGYREVFRDDFNTLDTTRWGTHYSNRGASQHQLQCYMPQNVSTSQGILTLSARREEVECDGHGRYEFTSGMISSNKANVYYPRFARYEFRAKIPHAQGVGSSFWLTDRRGAKVAEVDIVENFHASDPGRTKATLHLDTVDNESWKKARTPVLAYDEWHVWGVQIEPAGQFVKFSFDVDGQTYWTISTDEAHSQWARSGDAANAFNVNISFSLGSDWQGNPDGRLGQLENLKRCAQGGTYPNCSTEGIMRGGFGPIGAAVNPSLVSGQRAVFPQLYQVDWFRVLVR